MRHDITGVDDRIRSVLEQRLLAGHAPGAIVAVTDRERTTNVVSCGTSDLATGKPFDGGSLIRLSSLSKSFVALVVLQEMERGTLRPDLRVGEMAPWCRLREPYGPITLHHLMTHTAGLARGSDACGDALYAAYNLRNVDPGGPPGRRFHYSNNGWKLVGILLEEATGQPLHALIRDRVLSPLEMNDSLARMEAADVGALAARYCRVRPGRPLTRHDPLMPVAWTPYTAADGCVAATVDDLCRYARMLLNRGAGPHGRLLPADRFDTLFQRWTEDDQIGWYGLGWWIFERSGRTYVMHPGYQAGSSCVLVLDPAAGLATFTAANGTFDVRTPGEYALAAVRAARSGQALPAPPRIRRGTRILEASDYAGEYRGDGAFELVPDADGLRLRSATLDVVVERVDPIMRPAFAPETLVVPAPPFDRHFIELERAADGTVVRAYHGPRRYGRSPHPADDSTLPDRWNAYPGTYRSPAPAVPSITVVGRHGRLWLLDEWQTAPLVPLPDGSFRVGEAEWIPERLTFGGVTPRGAALVSAAGGMDVWYRVAEEDPVTAA